jgi:hypothetical protein
LNQSLTTRSLPNKFNLGASNCPAVFYLPKAKAGYFFFFEPDGNTLATALAIEPATFAMTPFFELRFFALGFVFDFVRAFGAVLDFAFFFAAVFAITDSPTL